MEDRRVDGGGTGFTLVWRERERERGMTDYMTPGKDSGVDVYAVLAYVLQYIRPILRTRGLKHE